MMRADWDKLKEEYAGGARKLVAEVDCRTKAGAKLCRKHGIHTHPSVKWGSPDALESYDGHRGYEALKQFAEHTLKRTCSPTSLDECDADMKSDLEKMLSMSHTQLESELDLAKQAAKGGVDGWCNLNHFSDAVAEHGTPVVESISACAAECAKESKCKAFSFSPRETCHRYESACSKKLIQEDERFTTFNKVVHEDGEGDLSDFALVRGPKKASEATDMHKAKMKKDESRLAHIHTIKAMRKEEL